MATKKSSKAVKKVPAKKTTTKKVVRKAAPRKTGSSMPGGYIMYVFLIIAALAAIVAIAGIILENGVDTANTEQYQKLFDLIRQCKSVSLGIFGIFLVLACFTKMNNK